jgi:hypothetical protein
MRVSQYNVVRPKEGDMAKVSSLSVTFERDADTKRKAKYRNPEDAPLQGVLYLDKTSVPEGKDLKITYEFVDQED